MQSIVEPQTGEESVSGNNAKFAYNHISKSEYASPKRMPPIREIRVI